MTSGLLGPFGESRNTVARHGYSGFMPQVGLIQFPLLLVDQDRFQAFHRSFVGIRKPLPVLDFSESIYRSDHGDVQVKVYIHTDEHLLG